MSRPLVTGKMGRLGSGGVCGGGQGSGCDDDENGGGVRVVVLLLVVVVGTFERQLSASSEWSLLKQEIDWKYKWLEEDIPAIVVMITGEIVGYATTIHAMILPTYITCLVRKRRCLA